MNKPYELTAQEWEEVAGVRAVQESFGLEDEAEPAAWLANYAYGVRFDYENEGPGYQGPLYLLKSADAPYTLPLIVVRTRQGLQALAGWLMQGLGGMQSSEPLCTSPICDGTDQIFFPEGPVCANRGCPNYMHYA